MKLLTKSTFKNANKISNKTIKFDKFKHEMKSNIGNFINFI